MAYFLFLLVVGVLFLRPQELIPDLGESPIYEVVILACLMAAVRDVAGRLSPQALIRRPLTVCLLGLLASVPLSHLVQGATFEARVSGFMFFKIIILCLLLDGSVTSFGQLRRLLVWLVLLITLMATLAVLHYHGHVVVPALEPYGESVRDPITGELTTIRRLCGPGIFHDPNDLCVVLAIGGLIALYLLTDRDSGALRLVWLAPMGLFGHAMTLTHSRGGFIAAAFGCIALLHSRFKGWKAAAIVALTLPTMLLAFGGRQTHFDFGDREDTSQHRLRLWSEGLELLKSQPVFGIGQGRYEEAAGQVAHNSFLQAYTELGFLGGTCFLSAFLYAFGTLSRLARLPAAKCLDPGLRRMHPYLTAVLAAAVGGMLSLSRTYNPPTYILLGLVAVYFRLAAKAAPREVEPVSARLVLRMTTVSLGCLVLGHLFVVLVVRR